MSTFCFQEKLLPIVIFAALFLAFTGDTTKAQEFQKLAPFTSVRWTSEELPEAQIDGNWYAIVAIDNADITDVMNFCIKTWPDKAQKRFEEDLVEVLSRMGNPPKNDRLTIRVVDLKTKVKKDLVDVLLTAANRRGLVSSKMRPTRKRKVSAAEAILDLQDFQRQLESRFAYLNTNNVDYQSAIARVKSRITDPIDVGVLEMEVGKIISMFVDGHASPRGEEPRNRNSFRLPFLMETAGDRFVAVKIDRTALLDDQHPFVVSLDGVAIERWLASMDPVVCQGSPQLVRRRQARNLRKIDWARERLGLPRIDELRVGLVSADGSSSAVVSVKLSRQTSRPARLNERECGMIDGVGYLRLSSFSDESPSAVDLIKKWMPKFRSGSGLIIDVRNNGGGSREALLELFPYLLESGESRVGNVCAYRLYEKFGKSHLEARFAYRATSDRWDENERKTIESFQHSFRPEWQFEKDRFSDWHYLVLSKRAGDHRFFFGKPVVLLTNSYCFSATDIFVGAFKGFRNVTIMGQATGGGSARTQSEYLPNSGIEIRLASMVSFQPNGLLYDGRGVAADIHVDQSPESFLVSGEDNVLNEALKFLSAKNK